MRPAAALPAKLVVGVLTAEKGLITGVAGALSERFGPMDMVSPWMLFSDTLYYEKEMGGPLYRRVFAFSRLVDQGDLADAKVWTNAVETDFSIGGNRQVNIDPGHLLHARFVLATAKDHAHRIFIGNGIYADLTLTYRAGEFRPLPWTFPDYTAKTMIGFLTDVRRRYDAACRLQSGQPFG